MELFVQRHGIAEFARRGESDFDRELTKGGQTLLRKQVQGLKHIVGRETLLFHSPYKRAAQTAAILSKELGLQKFEELTLGCGCQLDDVLEILDSHGQPEKAWIVGHQPDLGQIIYTMTGQSVMMNTGTLVQLEAYPDSGQISRVVRVLQPEDQVALSKK